MRERTCGAKRRERRPVPQPISRTLKDESSEGGGKRERYDSKAREVASWMEGLESQLAASVLKRALPVPVVGVGSVAVVWDAILQGQRFVI